MSKDKHAAEGQKWIVVRYPLRPGFVATLEVPRDMTTAEAERLAAMLMTLPIPQEGS